MNKTNHIGDWESWKQGNAQPFIIRGLLKDKILIRILMLKWIKITSDKFYRDERRVHSLTEDCNIDPFLTHVEIPNSAPYVVASWTRGSQLDSLVWPWVLVYT